MGFYALDVVQDLHKKFVASADKAIKCLYNKVVNIMSKLPVAKHLNDNEYKLFLDVYQKHNRSMGLEERKNYTLSHVVKVERSKNCLKVYYENGDWWYYAPDGTWY